jgi:drug/metabolite transporter (DMT)-like permease
MNWLVIAIIAHFLFALVFIVDKFLLSRTTLKPIVYAFYTGVLQLFVLAFVPFGFSMPPFEQIMISFLAGALFTAAVLFLYRSFQLGEVSRITPIIGGAIPLFTLILTYIFLEERLTAYQFLAFFLLVLGGVVMVWPVKKELIGAVKIPLAKRLPLAFTSSLFFAGSFVLTKLIFNYQPFVNGFIWTRLGGFLMAGLFVIWPKNRRLILKTTKSLGIKTVSLFFSDKILAALAFILLNYAIFLGNVSLVNALQGIQYVFLFLIAVFLSIKFPKIIKEQISQRAVFQRAAAILLIGVGLGLLAF